MAYSYPRSDLDEPLQLVELLGSFWAEVFPDRDAIREITGALGRLENITVDGFEDLLKTISRFTVPVYPTQEWWPLELTESARNQTTASLPRFNGDFTYSEGGIHFDVAVDNLHCWALPTGLVAAPLLFNRIADPSLSYVDRIDYTVRDGAICFTRNPFNDERVYVADVVENNTVTDRVAQLWLYRPSFERNAIYTQFGHAVGVQAASSVAYRDLVNAVYDAMVAGSTKAAITKALSAMTGVPFAAGSETVEVIFDDGRYQWIITDQTAYSYHRQATALVSVGDAVVVGQPLVDTVQVFDLGRGQVPADLSALVLGEGFLGAGYLSELTFENKTVDWQITTDDGKTRMEFQLGGFPGDVSAFWDTVHDRGVAAGQTLANLLDTRPDPDPDEEPTALALPVRVNPLEFLIENVLRNNLFIILVKPATFGESGLGLQYGDVLRKLIPPQTSTIMAIELDMIEEPVTMEGPGSATAPGYEEDVGVYLGVRIEEELNITTMATESVRVVTSTGFLG